MADILYALRQRLNNLLIDQPSKRRTPKRPVDCCHIVEGAGLAFFEERGSVLGFWLDDGGEFGDGFPFLVCAAQVLVL